LSRSRGGQPGLELADRHPRRLGQGEPCRGQGHTRAFRNGEHGSHARLEVAERTVDRRLAETRRARGAPDAPRRTDRQQRAQLRERHAARKRNAPRRIRLVERDVVQSIQRACHGVGEDRAGLGRKGAVGPAFEQRAAQMSFDRGYALCERRLAEADRARGSAKMVGPAKLERPFEVTKIEAKRPHEWLLATSNQMRQSCNLPRRAHRDRRALVRQEPSSLTPAPFPTAAELMSLIV